MWRLATRGCWCGLLLALAVTAGNVPPAKGIKSRADWRNFGKQVLATAPAAVSQGSALDQARYVAAQASAQMEAEGISPNTGWGGRFYNKAWHGDAGFGNCSTCGAVMEDVMAGAGLAKDDNSFQLTTVGKAISYTGFIPDPINGNHGAFVMNLPDAKGEITTVVFDNWASAAEKDGYLSGAHYSDFDEKDPWNGMSVWEWRNRMWNKGYRRFAVNDSTDYNYSLMLALDALNESWEKTEKEGQELGDQILLLREKNPEVFAERVGFLQRNVKDLVYRAALARLRERLAGQPLLPTMPAEMQAAAERKQAAWEEAKLGKYPDLTYADFEKYYDADKGKFLPPTTFVAVAQATDEQLQAEIDAELEEQDVQAHALEWGVQEAFLDRLHALGADTEQARQAMAEHATELGARLAEDGYLCPVSVEPDGRGWRTVCRTSNGSVPYGPQIAYTHGIDLTTADSSDDFVTGTYVCPGYGGVFKKWYPNGTVEERRFVDQQNKQHGPACTWFSSGAPHEEREFNHGKMVGWYRFYEEVGAERFHFLSHEERWVDGVADGPWRTWHGDGRLTVDGQYSAGKQSGIWETWDDRKWDKWEVNWRDGVKDGKARNYARDGRLVEEQIWKDGRRNGVTRKWWANGNLYEVINYKDGQFDGTYDSYAESGKHLSTSYYENGKHVRTETTK